MMWARRERRTESLRRKLTSRASDRWALACLAIGVVIAFSGCDMGGVPLDASSPPPTKSRDERKFQVPVAAVELPAGHRIGPNDIEMQPMSRDDMLAAGWDLNQTMMLAEQIKGRVTKIKILAGSPLYTSDIHLSDE